jgi:hypothetical protein
MGHGWPCLKEMTDDANSLQRVVNHHPVLGHKHEVLMLRHHRPEIDNDRRWLPSALSRQAAPGAASHRASARGRSILLPFATGWRRPRRREVGRLRRPYRPAMRQVADRIKQTSRLHEPAWGGAPPASSAGVAVPARTPPSACFMSEDYGPGCCGEGPARPVVTRDVHSGLGCRRNRPVIISRARCKGTQAPGLAGSDTRAITSGLLRHIRLLYISGQSYSAQEDRTRPG